MCLSGSTHSPVTSVAHCRRAPSCPMLAWVRKTRVVKHRTQAFQGASMHVLCHEGHVRMCRVRMSVCMQCRRRTACLDKPGLPGVLHDDAWRLGVDVRGLTYAVDILLEQSQRRGTHPLLSRMCCHKHACRAVLWTLGRQGVGCCALAPFLLWTALGADTIPCPSSDLACSRNLCLLCLSVWRARPRGDAHLLASGRHLGTGFVGGAYWAHSPPAGVLPASSCASTCRPGDFPPATCPGAVG